MTVALVGLGYWGAKLLRNLTVMLGPEGVLGVDRDPQRREAAAKQHPQLALAASVDEALAHDDVDSVVLATPLESHARLARQALHAGRHVLVEKPLAGSVSDALEMCQLAEDRGLNLMVGHTFLFSPRVRRVAESVHQGQLGRVHYTTSSRLALGLYRRDANVIWDLAPHDFSIVCHLLREFPVEVQTAARSLSPDGLPDVAFVNLTFPSGAIAAVAVSWIAPRKVRNTLVVGERGMIVYDDTEPDEPVKIYDRGVETVESDDFGEHQLTYRYGDTISPHVSAQEPLALELEHFFSCNRSGESCLSDGWFGLEIVRVLDAADRSWRAGGRPMTVGTSTSDGVTRRLA